MKHRHNVYGKTYIYLHNESHYYVSCLSGDTTQFYRVLPDRSFQVVDYFEEYENLYCCPIKRVRKVYTFEQIQKEENIYLMTASCSICNIPAIYHTSRFNLN